MLSLISDKELEKLFFTRNTVTLYSDSRSCYVVCSQEDAQRGREAAPTRCCRRSPQKTTALGLLVNQNPSTRSTVPDTCTHANTTRQ